MQVSEKEKCKFCLTFVGYLVKHHTMSWGSHQNLFVFPDRFSITEENRATLEVTEESGTPGTRNRKQKVSVSVVLQPKKRQKLSSARFYEEFPELYNEDRSATDSIVVFHSMGSYCATKNTTIRASHSGGLR